MADDTLRRAIDRFGVAYSADLPNIERALEDFEFFAVDSWPSEWRKARELAKQPVLEVPQLEMYLKQVINDARLNPPAIKVRPADDGADVKGAELRSGIVRNIEQQSQADIAYIHALSHAVIGGIGHFRVHAHETDDEGWDQELRILPIYSPHAVTWDHGARHPLRTDADFVFVSDLITKEQFERDYPDSTPADWSSHPSPSVTAWSVGDRVRIAEYWYKKPKRRKLLLLTTGETLDQEKLSAPEIEMLRGQGMIKRDRTVESFVICQVMLSAHDVLSDEIEWPGRHFPIIPVIGNEVHVGDQLHRYGMVRKARDVQTLINVHTSGLAESIALSSKAKWLATADQLVGHEKTWERAHLDNFPYLLFNPDVTSPGPPMRVQPAAPDASLVTQLGLATQDLQRVMGIFPANLGQEDNSKSGRAILLRQKEGDVGSFNYIDNLARAVEQCGRILIDLLPHHYDTARVVRVIGDDDATDMVPINQIGPTGQMVHDLSAGKYDVVAKAGPSFSTKREEGMQFLLEMMRAVPAAQQLAPDLLAKAADVPYGDELAKRFRKTLLAQGIVEPEEGDPQPQPQPPSPEQMIAQAEIMKAQTAAKKAESDDRMSAVEAQLKVIAAILQRDKLRLDAAEAMQQGIKIDHDMRNDDARLQLDAANKMIGHMTRPSGGSGAPN